MNKWHIEVQNKLRDELSSFVKRGSKRPITNPFNPSEKYDYSPDLLLEKDGRTIVIELESTSRTTKVIEDLLFSFMAEVDELVIVFSDIMRRKHVKKRGEYRVKGAKRLESIIRGRFRKMNIELPKTRILYVVDENDQKLVDLCSSLRDGGKNVNIPK